MKINTNKHYGSSVECGMCPIDAVCTVVEILSHKYIPVRAWTWGYVTSLVTWFSVGALLELTQILSP